MPLIFLFKASKKRRKKPHRTLSREGFPPIGKDFKSKLICSKGMKSWVGVWLIVTLLLLLASSTSLFFASAGTPDEWRTRTIYQLLTDRFAQTQGNTQPCNNLQQYCGGTFKGIINDLPYIKG